MEPCGCVSNMLGGIDHAAALVERGTREAPNSLVVAAGPIWFENPALEPKARTQHVWKAEVLAAGLAQLKLMAWAPAANDWAAGAPELERLSQRARANVLAGNLAGSSAGAIASRILERDGYRIGLAGISLPLRRGQPPSGVRIEGAGESLERSLAELRRKGAQILVALVAAPRGEALRLAEKVPGFHVMVVGKPYDEGESNDSATPPVLIGSTLVVQPENHLQAISVVDFFVQESGFKFLDGSNIQQEQQRLSLQQRIRELESRLDDWKRHPDSVNQRDVQARQKDLEQLREQLSKLSGPVIPSNESFFTYGHEPVRAELGSHSGIAAELRAYYRRVNQHNREAFKDHRPQPAGESESSYIGIEKCSSCHAEERKFWNTTAHFKAYATLANQDKQYNLDCVGCHVTGYEKPGGSTVTFVEDLKDVQCESCHGPGSRHLGEPTNRKFIVSRPQRSLCAASCHYPPHVHDDWDVNQAWKGIIGPGHGG
jgi:hypothetical protein